MRVTLCTSVISCALLSTVQAWIFPSRYESRRMAMCAQTGRVTMYTKTTCQYCRKALELLEGKHKLRVSLVDVLDADSTKKAAIVQQMTTFSGGRTTVPQIFFNSEHLGGYDDIAQLDQDGILSTKVEEVRRTPEPQMQEHWFHPWY